MVDYLKWDVFLCQDVGVTPASWRKKRPWAWFLREHELMVKYMDKRFSAKNPILKNVMPSFLLACLLAGANFVGYFLTVRGGIDGIAQKSIASLGIAAVGQVILYTAVLSILWYLGIQKISFIGKAPKILNDKWFYFTVMMIGWLPALLAYFPAVYSYDAQVQLEQWISGKYDIHHPLLHTMLMGICYQTGQAVSRLLPFRVDGMVFYSLLQMGILAYAISSAFSLLVKKNAAGWLRILLLGFFVLFPMIPIMAVSMTKDAIFSALFLWSIVLLAENLWLQKTFTIRKSIEYIVISVLMMLFRNNAVYAWCVLVVCMLIVLLLSKKHTVAKRKSLKEFMTKPQQLSDAETLKVLIALSIFAVIAYVIFSFLLVRVTDAEHGEKKEMLNIPIQQLARIYKSDSDTMTQEELEEIYYFIPQIDCANYRMWLSDPVKMHFREDHYKENPDRFWKCYLHIIVRHPSAAVMAGVYLTMGYWYPEDISHTRIYESWWRDRICYLVTDEIPVFYDDYVIKQRPVPVLTQYYEMFATKLIQLRIPVVRQIFAPATYSIGVILWLLLALKRKKSEQFLLTVPVWAYLLTLLLGPGVIVRYLMPLMICVPVGFSILFISMWEEK